VRGEGFYYGEVVGVAHFGSGYDFEAVELFIVEPLPNDFIVFTIWKWLRNPISTSLSSPPLGLPLHR
jgi:hypothetical protein